MEYKHNKDIVFVARTLRKNMTKEERHLWYDFLREYPVKFLRQKPIGNYVVDFYCAQANLVIELDGSQHYDAEGLRKDKERTDFLESYGIKVLRITNLEMHKNFRGVCEYIDNLVQQSLRQPIG
ncbi:MAG: endonuclease domain-containing protein [Ruminococcus sp.]|nr:endonuclease domain-containing protein [Ruminococcus sp.]